MGRIVAIGGGDLQTTKSLNQYAIGLSEKQHPKLLFVGTASEDAEGYIENIHNAFEALGCQVQELSLTRQNYTQNQIDERLQWADIVYIGGGDTRSMMEIWKRHSFDKKLIDIYQKNQAVLMGISAGAICWFDRGHSDCESFTGKENWQYIFVDGMLGIHKYALCPHYNEEGRESFDEMLKDADIPGIALDSETAFVDNNGQISFIRSRTDANAYIIKYDNLKIEKTQVVFGREIFCL